MRRLPSTAPSYIGKEGNGSKGRGVTGDTTFRSVNSCLLPIGHCDGVSITTSEGLGNSAKGFHAIQGVLPPPSPGHPLPRLHVPICTPRFTAFQEKLFKSFACSCFGCGMWVGLGRGG